MGSVKNTEILRKQRELLVSSRARRGCLSSPKFFWYIISTLSSKSSKCVFFREKGKDILRLLIEYRHTVHLYGARRMLCISKTTARDVIGYGVDIAERVLHSRGYPEQSRPSWYS